MNTVRKLLPLLALYCLIILLTGDANLKGDEGRFFQYAKNLVAGFYTSSDNPLLHNGPGYPLFLTPLVAFRIPIFFMILTNGVLIFGAILFFYKTLSLFSKEKTAMVATYALGIYYPIFRQMNSLNSEPLAFFLICGFIYFTFLCFHNKSFSFRSFLWPSLFLGGLILTKVFFGNVTVASLVFALIIFAFSKNQKALKFVLILGLGFVVAIPYLGYTYSKTGRLYYWGTNGGELLYWMSSPAKEEYGKWISEIQVLEKSIPGMDSRHYDFFSSITETSHVKRNDIFHHKAKEQIIEHPEIYLFRVIIVNPLRLFFGYPDSYKEQNLTIFFYMLYHMFLIVIGIFSLYPAWKNWKKIPQELSLLVLFILIYLGGTILVGANPRYLVPAIPFIVLWITFVYTNFVDIKIR